MPSKQDYDEYYGEANSEFPDFVLNILDKTIVGFEKFRQGNRLLDIGCGAGAILEAARRRNWEVEGMEVSEGIVNHLRGKNFKVWQGYLEDFNFPAESYDVITATEVVEHLDKPRETVSEIHRIIRKGGIFWGTTPNCKGISAYLMHQDWSVFCPPEHIFLYSPKGLQKLLESAGFKEITIKTRGFNPIEYLSFRRLKKKHTPKPEEQVRGYNYRVATGYKLNEKVSSGLAKILIKDSVNFTLNLTGLGDSLRFWAIK